VGKAAGLELGGAMLRKILGATVVGAAVVILGASAVTRIGPRLDVINVCSLEYRNVYLKTHDRDAVLRQECPFEPWYRPGVLEPTRKIGLCDIKYPWYRERGLRAIENLRSGSERWTDVEIAAGYCPYDGSWRRCSIRRCRIIPDKPAGGATDPG
jgi:hypothetical protein